MKIRLISVLLTAVLLCSLLPQITLTSHASDSGTCGDSLTWSYDSASGTLTIAGSGDMTDFSNTSSTPWSKYRESITAVVLPDGLTGIGKYAFSGCTALTSVAIPSSVKSSGFYAFNNCSSLQSVEISNLSAWCTIAYTTTNDNPLFYAHNLFLNGVQVTELEIPGGISSIGDYTFAGCSSLTGLTIPDGVATIGQSAFYRCTALTDVTVPDSVKNIKDGAFSGCSSITSVRLPKGLTTINDFMFSGCKSLTGVTIPSGVTQLGDYAFANCESLTSMFIPYRVTSIDSCTFSCCTALTSITIPSSVTQIGDRAFFGCTALTGVTIPDSVTKIGEHAFSECTALTSITIPSNVTKIKSYTFLRCTALTSVTIPDSVTVIDFCAFTGCTALTSVTIPDSVTVIGFCAFYGCTALTEIKIPCSVTEIGDHAFSNCTALTCISIPDSVMSIETEALGYYKPEGESKYIKLSGFTICCNTGTAAEVYANENGFAIIPPLSVRSVSLSNVASTGKPKVSWDAVSDAVKYEIWRSSSKSGDYTLAYTTSKLTYVNSNAKPGETWYYKVRALDGTGKAGPFSALKSRTCDLPRPVVTGGHAASSGKNRITWKKVSGAKEYKVYRSDAKDTGYSLVKTVGASAELTCTDTDAVAGKTYYYRVKAIHSKSSAKSAYSEIKVLTCDLPRPVVSGTHDPATGKNKLTWKAVKGAAGYRVYRSASRDVGYKLIKTTTNLSFTNTGAKAGEIWYYKVMAIHKKEAANSARSAVKALTCDLPRPVVSIALSSGKPKLTWEKITRAREYRIYRSDSKNGSYDLMKTTTGTASVDSSAKKGKTYYYKVVAVHSRSTADSAFSLAKSITATK